jgi:hypothetical protein
LYLYFLYFYCAFIKSIQGLPIGYWTCHKINYKIGDIRIWNTIIKRDTVTKIRNDLRIWNTIIKIDTVTEIRKYKYKIRNTITNTLSI